MYDLNLDHGFTGKWHGDIYGAIRNARVFLETHPEGVQFKWNGHATVIITPELSDRQVLANYEAEKTRLVEEHRRSLEGITAAENARSAEKYWNSPTALREDRLRKSQIKLDNATLAMADVKWDDQAAVLDWINSWYEAADHIGVKYNREKFIACIESGGWMPGDACGLAKTEYLKKDIMGKYLIGQVLSCMHSGMAPHPIFSKFYEDWSKINA